MSARACVCVRRVQLLASREKRETNLCEEQPSYLEGVTLRNTHSINIGIFS